MKDSIINIKTDAQTKHKAHKIAGELGLSLSTVLNAYLRQLIKDKAVHFSVEPHDMPSKRLKSDLAQADKDEKAGYISPAFDNFDNSIAWLRDPQAKYLNGKHAHRIRKAIRKKI